MDNTAVLRAGTAETDITPPAGCALMGYPDIKSDATSPASHKPEFGYRPRVGGALGRHDPLTARTLALESSEGQVALIAVDLCVVTNDLTQRVRDLVQAELDIPRDHLILAATHTHSGPDIYEIWSEGGSAFFETTANAIAQSARTAFERLLPVSAAVGFGDVGELLINRYHPEGLIDSEMTVLSFENAEGAPVAVVIALAAHPIVLASDNRMYSCDYPGYLVRFVEGLYPGARCLFFNGAAGNVNPVGFPLHPKEDIVGQHRRALRLNEASPRGFRHAKRLGRLMGLEAVKVLEGATPSVRSTSCLQHSISKARLPLKSKEMRKGFCDYVSLGETHRRWIMEAEDFPTEIHALQVGPVNIVCLPGEPFAETGLAVKHLCGQPTMVIGNANSDPRYIPPKDAFSLQSYERMATPLGPDAADELMGATVRALGGLDQRNNA